MSLYTLLIDFDGGSYICQASSKSSASAPIECVKAWDTSDIEHVVSESDKAEILSQLEDEEFTPVVGLEKVWCGCVILKTMLATLNLIETAE